MFSVIFPGQGSQAVGMAKNLYDNFAFVKELFQKSDNILNQNLSKIILEGPKNELDLTENTQPCIFLVSYCIAEMIKREINFNLNKAEYFAGHSLGEYTALTVSESLSFEKTIYLLKKDDGSEVQISICPAGHGKIKSPMCCGADMACTLS